MNKHKLTKRALKKLDKYSDSIEHNITKIENTVNMDKVPRKFFDLYWELLQAWGSLDCYVYKKSTTKKQRAEERAKHEANV